MLDHEKLDVYQAARQLNRELGRIIRPIRGRSEWVDQARRAGGSIPLNIAESTGHITKGDKIKHLRYAKGSACECAALLDLLVDDEILSESEIVQAKMLIERIVGMLIRLIDSIHQRPEPRAKR